jgi:hypothetical protein
MKRSVITRAKRKRRRTEMFDIQREEGEVGESDVDVDSDDLDSIVRVRDIEAVDESHVGRRGAVADGERRGEMLSSPNSRQIDGALHWR